MSDAPAVSEDVARLRRALEQREHQVAVLRAELADRISERDLAVADSASHEREAAGQRDRADRLEREVIAVNEATAGEIARLREKVAQLEGSLPLRAARSLGWPWRAPR